MCLKKGQVQSPQFVLLSGNPDLLPCVRGLWSGLSGDGSGVWSSSIPIDSSKDCQLQTEATFLLRALHLPSRYSDYGGVRPD